MVSTNLGLLQANMMWLNKKHGLSYHWLLDLFTHLKLPIFNGMPEALKKANEVRAKNLAKNKQKKQKTNVLIEKSQGARTGSKKIVGSQANDPAHLRFR